MMISCLLAHPLYSDHVMSGETTYTVVYLFYNINMKYSVPWDTYNIGATENH